MAEISPTLVRVGNVEEANFFQQSVEASKVITFAIVDGYFVFVNTATFYYSPLFPATLVAFSLVPV